MLLRERDSGVPSIDVLKYLSDLLSVAESGKVFLGDVIFSLYPLHGCVRKWVLQRPKMILNFD